MQLDCEYQGCCKDCLPMEICKNNLSYLTDMTEYDIFCLYGFDRSYQRCSVCLWMSWLFFYSIRPACGPQRCGIVKWWIFEHLNITLGTKRWVSFSRKYYFLIKILFFCEKKKSSFWRHNSLTELKSSPRGMQEIFATSDHLQMLWTLSLNIISKVQRKNALFWAWAYIAILSVAVNVEDWEELWMQVCLHYSV